VHVGGDFWSIGGLRVRLHPPSGGIQFEIDLFERQQRDKSGGEFWRARIDPPLAARDRSQRTFSVALGNKLDFRMVHDDTPPMIYLPPILFLGAAVAATVLILMSNLSVTYRVILAFCCISFVAMAYVLAVGSKVSPFGSSNPISFGGVESDATPVIVGIGGAIAGVIGSYFFTTNLSAFRWSALVRPLCTVPLVLIPTVKLIGAANDGTILSLLLLFGLSYQNGFFWERLLRQPES
jgi:hypothetical protein